MAKYLLLCTDVFEARNIDKVPSVDDLVFTRTDREAYYGIKNGIKLNERISSLAAEGYSMVLYSLATVEWQLQQILLLHTHLQGTNSFKGKIKAIAAFNENLKGVSLETPNVDESQTQAPVEKIIEWGSIGRIDHGSAFQVLETALEIKEDSYANHIVLDNDERYARELTLDGYRVFTTAESFLEGTESKTQQHKPSTSASDASLDCAAFFKAKDKLQGQIQMLDPSQFSAGSGLSVQQITTSVFDVVLAEAQRIGIDFQSSKAINKVDPVRLAQLTEVLTLTSKLLEATPDKLLGALMEYKNLFSDINQRPWGKIIAGCMVAFLSAIVLGLAVTAAVSSFGTVLALMVITLLLGGASVASQGISIGVATLAIVTLCGGLGFALAHSRAPESDLAKAMRHCFDASKEWAERPEVQALTLSNFPGL